MTCEHCGAALPAIAMFCGECGRSVSARSVAPRVDSRPEPPVTAQIDPEPEVVSSPEPVAAPEPPAAPEPLPTGAHLNPTLSLCAECDTEAQVGDVYCAECGHRLADDTRVIEAIVSPLREVPAAPLPAVPAEPLPAVPAAASVPPTTVHRQHPGERFVLQFSTGESYTVLGSGLAGRNPRPEPGEVVDHLVTIVDPGRSVSKTHLEFGQSDGALWISDRYSGNGTVIRTPDADPFVCVPGRRYVIARGTRIDLGEQFVIVS